MPAEILPDEIVSREASVTASEDAARSGAQDEALQPGAILAGRYEVRNLLGQGGTGVVMRAHDRILGVDVAIKLLRQDLGRDRRWIERLAREVRTTRQIRHPNVCRVFDFQQTDGRPFIVMELATGTLAGEIAAGTWPARPEQLRIADARAIASGLAAIHEAGVVHRDLSTRNILRLPDGPLVLSDLGLAIGAADSHVTVNGGTVAYMAPELGAGSPASAASDIWALGIIIHEIMFGARPAWRNRAMDQRLERPRRRLSASITTTDGTTTTLTPNCASWLTLPLSGGIFCTNPDILDGGTAD